MTKKYVLSCSFVLVLASSSLRAAEEGILPWTGGLKTNATTYLKDTSFQLPSTVEKLSLSLVKGNVILQESPDAYLHLKAEGAEEVLKKIYYVFSPSGLSSVHDSKSHTMR